MTQYALEGFKTVIVRLSNSKRSLFSTSTRSTVCRLSNYEDRIYVKFRNHEDIDINIWVSRWRNVLDRLIFLAIDYYWEKYPSIFLYDPYSALKYTN